MIFLMDLSQFFFNFINLTNTNHTKFNHLEENLIGFFLAYLKDF